MASEVDFPRHLLELEALTREQIELLLDLAARFKHERAKARKGSAHAPKHVSFVSELPMTGVGKVDKKVLKAGFWVGRDRLVG